MFEVKGLIINEAENDMLVQTCVCETMKFKLSTTVAIYSLCYSIMKSCAYWTSKTLSSIVDNGKRLCDSLSLDMNLPSNTNLPKSVDFCGVEVNFDLKSDIIEGVLFEPVQNIIKNNSECTGFLIWFASFCVSCISKSIQKSKYVYSLVSNNFEIFTLLKDDFCSL